jgi:hypothetical protein
MQFRSKKIPTNLDGPGSIANSLVMQATGKQLLALFGEYIIGHGADQGYYVAGGGILIPKSVGARWRIVGVGAYIAIDGTSTVAEEFGSFVMDTTADKQLKYGDFIYAGIAPFSDYFNFDAPELAGAHTWDISGAGAGVLMGEWLTKSAELVMVKEHVANSTARGYSIFLIEIETGGGVT